MAGRFGPTAPTEQERRERMKPFLDLGKAADIEFDLEVVAQYQPIESQRLLLWAGRFGKQEEFMSALNRRHFEKRESASLRPTLLSAAFEVGMDVEAATAFLDTDELAAEVVSCARQGHDSEKRRHTRQQHRRHIRSSCECEVAHLHQGAPDHATTRHA